MNLGNGLEFKVPQHFTQAFGLEKRESDLDFFDVNLQYDSRIFIDPFLIRKSAIETERVLFDRFGDFFRYAYDLSLTISTDVDDYNKLKDLLNIHEPEEIGLGYTESSHRGTGPGPSFAGQLFNFFVNSSAKIAARHSFPPFPVSRWFLNFDSRASFAEKIFRSKICFLN